MSGYGLGGFAQGFLAGFDSMGQHFARRGTLQQREQELAQQQQQSEADLALRQQEMAAHTRLADAADRRAQERWELEQPNLKLDNQIRQETAPEEIRKAGLTNQQIETNIAAGKSDTAYRDAVTGTVAPESQVRVAATEAQTNASNANTQLTNLRTEEERAKLNQYQQQIGAQKAVGEAVNAFAGGQPLNPEHWQTLHKLGPLWATITNPTFEDDFKNLSAAWQQAGKTQDTTPFDNPKTMGSVGRLMQGYFNVPVGQPVGNGRVYVRAEPVKMLLSDDKNAMSFDLNVTTKPSPEREQALRAQLAKTNAPAERQKLEQELQETQETKPLTVDRIPESQGGQRLWIPRDQVLKVAAGLKAIGNLREQNPELLKTLRTMQQTLLAGELPGSGEPDPKETLDRELKVREDTRKTGKEQRAIRKEKLDRIDRIIMDRYKITDLANLTQSLGENGGRVQQERLLATRLLDEHPDWGEDQIMTEVARQLGEPKAAASARPKAGSPASESVKRLWR